jgi:hypothetical protein
LKTFFTVIKLSNFNLTLLEIYDVKQASETNGGDQYDAEGKKFKRLTEFNSMHDSNSSRGGCSC